MIFFLSKKFSVISYWWSEGKGRNDGSNNIHNTTKSSLYIGNLVLGALGNCSYCLMFGLLFDAEFQHWEDDDYAIPVIVCSSVSFALSFLFFIVPSIVILRMIQIVAETRLDKVILPVGAATPRGKQRRPSETNGGYQQHQNRSSHHQQQGDESPNSTKPFLHQGGFAIPDDSKDTTLTSRTYGTSTVVTPAQTYQNGGSSGQLGPMSATTTTATTTPTNQNNNHNNNAGGMMSGFLTPKRMSLDLLKAHTPWKTIDLSSDSEPGGSSNPASNTTTPPRRNNHLYPPSRSPKTRTPYSESEEEYGLISD